MRERRFIDFICGKWMENNTRADNVGQNRQGSVPL